MINLTTAAWITLGLVSLTSVLCLRGTVGAFGKGADNGWDNAFAYVFVSGLVLFAIAWLARTSYVFAALSPLILWTTQTLALKAIYQVRTFHAWLLGLLHTLFTTAVVSMAGFAVAVAIAYVLYGRIISDPMFLIRLLLRLIGIELPLQL